MSTAEVRDWTLRRRLRQAFGAVGAVLVLLVTAVIISAVLFANSGSQVIDRWQPAIVTTNQVVTDLVDQETGVRGYALVRDRDFLEPYVRYQAEETRDLARLARLLGDDRELQDRLATLRRAIDRWRDETAIPAIAALDRGDPATAVRLVASATAKQRFDALRARASELADRVRDRAEQARARRGLDGWIFVATGGVLLVVVLAAGFVLHRGLDRWVLAPVGALAAQTRRVASGATHQPIDPAGPVELTALARDVEAMRRRIASELERAEAVSAELQRRGDELARSNEDLQQFAYVASHDLSEPLRKVANFCQLLERQYGDQLDDRARQYIYYAVDGAKRMQALITDLLALSRVGRTTETFERLDLDAKLDLALTNLADRLADAGARVERTTPLPSVDGDRALLVSLFENLVGNAVKYRRPGVAPVVRVGAERGPQPGEWTFTVADNGIGIAPEYAERIFAVFQRLHLRDAYEGTGIGLALCRRIVEFHGGRIWLDTVESGSTAGAGATFRFTLREVHHAQPRD